MTAIRGVGVIGALVVIVVFGLTVAPAVSGAAVGTIDGEDGAADAESTESAPNATVSTFMQSTAADAEQTVESGMFEASYENADEDARAALVTERVDVLEDRVAELEAEYDELQTAENDTPAQQARMTRLTVEIAGVERSIDRTEHRAAETGVDDERLETLRENASDLSGPEVAELARGLAGVDHSGGGPPDDRGNGMAGNGSPPGQSNGNQSEHVPPRQSNGNQSEHVPPGQAGGNGTPANGPPDHSSGGGSDASTGPGSDSGTGPGSDSGTGPGSDTGPPAETPAQSPDQRSAADDESDGSSSGESNDGEQPGQGQGPDSNQGQDSNQRQGSNQGQGQDQRQGSNQGQGQDQRQGSNQDQGQDQQRGHEQRPNQ